MILRVFSDQMVPWFYPLTLTVGTFQWPSFKDGQISCVALSEILQEMQNVPFLSFQHFPKFLFTEIDRRQCHRDKGTASQTPAVILQKDVHSLNNLKAKMSQAAGYCNVSRHGHSIQAGGLLLLLYLLVTCSVLKKMKQYSAKDPGIVLGLPILLRAGCRKPPAYSTQFQHKSWSMFSPSAEITHLVLMSAIHAIIGVSSTI